MIPASGVEGEPILVVDDDEIKRYTTRRALEKAGFAVLEAVTGEEALDLLGRRAAPRPWLVVLDVRLPGIDGLEVCRRIKADPGTASILVLHLSAHHTGPEDRVSGMEAGADGYVTIPSDARVLVAQARSLLRLARAERASRDAARASREGEARLLTILGSLEEGVTLQDSRGVIRVTNASAERILGLTPDQLLGRTSLPEGWDTVSEDGSPLPHDRHPFTVALREGRPVVGAVMGVRPPGGELVWVSINAHPFSGVGGEAGVVTSFFDITERRRLERERAEAAARQERIAETLQRSLLLKPQIDAFAGIEVHVEYEAAWSESLLGGDFADAFAIDDTHVALVVGDVTGKGLVAATYTAEIKFALRAFLRESPDPGRAMSRLNHYLIEGQRLDANPHAEYVALTIAVMNRETREVRCSSAGAEPPLVVRRTGDAAAGPRAEAVEVAGALLAVDAAFEYGAVTARLGRGDLLAVTTDGITEARQAGGDRGFFGYEGFARAAAEAAALSSPLPAAARHIVASALRFADGEQKDDICLLVAR